MPIGFESGVPQFVHGIGLIHVYFPVDSKGREFCCCEQCQYYRYSSKSCAITDFPCLSPTKSVGQFCNLLRVGSDQAAKIEAVFAEVADEVTNGKQFNESENE